MRIALRTIGCAALFLAGSYALFVGQLSLIDVHVRPAPILGSISSILAIELFVFAWWVVRLAPGEVVVRMVLNLLLILFSLSQALWAVSDVLLPAGASVAGFFMDEDAGTKAVRFLLAAVGGANVFLVYRWAGAGRRSRLASRS